MYKVSVIVPIYNVEKYLIKCLDSLVKQTLQSKEIILVNDGSTDNSLLIAQQYVKKYSFVKLINKENGGQSTARNIGLRYATGKYILFVDSDDFIDSNTLEYLTGIAEERNLDILRGKCQYCDEDEKEIKIAEKIVQPFVVMDGVTYFVEALKGGSYDIVPVVNLIKKEYLDEIGLLFQENVSYEDQEYTLKLLTSGAKRVMQTNFKFYYYRQRNGSTTSVHNLRKAMDLIAIINEMVNYIEDSDFNEEVYNHAYMAVSIAVYHMTQVYIKMSKNDKSLFLSMNDDLQLIRKRVKFPTYIMRINIQNSIFFMSPILLSLIYRIKDLSKKF